jgi:lipopolysaccharide/colanic/teichoic acid biosynthesis glycosyltransferase
VIAGELRARRLGVRQAGRSYLVAKRAFDISFCLFLLPIVLPLLALCALAILVDSRGPVVIAQPRTGRDARTFRMFKFRTMVRNAEELKAGLAHLNVLPLPDFKIPNDPRITRVGKILRQTSLDELPQLFNVLRGDMSLVGPRPTSFSATTYSLWHSRRLEVTPGITGLWQIKGRNLTTFDERLRLDIEYIERRSLFFDLEILARTIPAVFRRSGA